jgi:hypothetical protein
MAIPPADSPPGGGGGCALVRTHLQYVSLHVQQRTGPARLQYALIVRRDILDSGYVMFVNNFFSSDSDTMY